MRISNQEFWGFSFSVFCGNFSAGKPEKKEKKCSLTKCLEFKAKEWNVTSEEYPVAVNTSLLVAAVRLEFNCQILCSFTLKPSAKI